MLPYPQHDPAFPAQQLSVRPVAGPIPLELGKPIALIAPGTVPVSEAPVPKAPVNENRKLDRGKHKIWIAYQLLVSAPSADAVPPQNCGQTHFGIPISAGTDGRHDLRSLLSGENIHHNGVSSVASIL